MNATEVDRLPMLLAAPSSSTSSSFSYYSSSWSFSSSPSSGGVAFFPFTPGVPIGRDRPDAAKFPRFLELSSLARSDGAHPRVTSLSRNFSALG